MRTCLPLRAFHGTPLPVQASGRGAIPSNSTRATTGSTNVFKFSSRDIDQLLDQARVTPDRARRAEMYWRVQRLIVEQVPFLFIAYADLFAGADIGSGLRALVHAHDDTAG